jgi:hypothetical protein
MRFYTQQHRHYCGIDLHARSLYLCILDQAGRTLLHRKLDCDREQLLRARGYGASQRASRELLRERPATASYGASQRADGAADGADRRPRR